MKFPQFKNKKTTAPIIKHFFPFARLEKIKLQCQQAAGAFVILGGGMIFSQEFWRRRRAANWALLPAAFLFGAAAAARRGLYRVGALRSESVGAPVIVVGNIVAGGGGKTPLVIALASALQQRGFAPGIAARGVGGNSGGLLCVGEETSWRECGDEPLLIFRRTHAPVCVCKERARAARALVEKGCNVILCDDGLQHYALRRDLEICAANANFGLGNGWQLPAGPLREGKNRIARCDILAVMQMESESALQKNAMCDLESLRHPQTMHVPIAMDGFYAPNAPDALKPAADFRGASVVALAGIAAPERFFNALRAEGIMPRQCIPLADHAAMDLRRLAALDADIILMTEKDAVKYAPSDSRIRAMKITARPPSSMIEAAVNIAESGKD